MSLFKPRIHIFYGWWIVTACLCINMYTGGVVFFGFTAVFEPIANEFGWSYAQISLAASLRGFEMGLLSPIIGLLVDRWGPKRLMFSGAFLGGLGLILLSRISSLGMFYSSFILITIGMSTCTSTVTVTAVANWFRKNMGIATGVVVSGFALGGLIVPLATTLIDDLGWRNAMVILGIGLWIIGLPLSLAVRHKPEQYGLHVDGIPDKPKESGRYSNLSNDNGKDIDVRQALMSRPFWHISFMAMYQTFAVSAVVTHVMPYFSSIGINRAVAGFMASAIPVASIGGRLSFGFLGDKFAKKWIAASGITMLIIGLILFGNVPNLGIWILLPFTVLFGVGWGGNVPMRPALLREYFGRKRIGTLLGFAFGVAVAGQIAGAPLAGWLFDIWGNYQTIWFLYAGLGIFALISILTIPRPDD